MKRIFDSRLMLIISMAIFGTIGLFRRSIDISSGELAFYRAVLASVFIGLFLLVTKNRIPFGKIKKQLPVLIISGIAMAFNWILLFEAYNYTTVSVATLSYYFAPVIVTVLCPILFKEKMGMKQWLCFIMSTFGIVLITGIGSFDTGSNHFLGILFGLGAACLYATVIILNKFTKGVDGIHRTFIQFVSAVIALCPYVLFTSGINITSLDKKGIALLLVVGLVHTGITYCMYFSSLKDLTGQKAAILSYIDPLVAVLCSALILHETMTVTQMIGGVLILGFTLWNELSPKKEDI
ncbi:MAG: EamA/RhaT family transporter [Ruminococcaceae bacterium]|nr:EamA/RhaT family transporter [Oscillospiraceae bacterium]